MSTEIFTQHESISLSNMMFQRVIRFASAYAREQVPSEIQITWVEKFAQQEAMYGQDISVEETFSSAAEVNFWTKVLFDCAQAIYERKIGNQADQEWQVGTIWALYSFARMLAGEYNRRVSVHGDI